MPATPGHNQHRVLTINDHPPTYFHHLQQQEQENLGQTGSTPAAAAAAAANADISLRPVMAGRVLPFHYTDGGEGGDNHPSWYSATTTGNIVPSTSPSFVRSPAILDKSNGHDIVVSPSTSTKPGEEMTDDKNNDHSFNRKQSLHKLFELRRRRRESHNAVERRRRETINDCIHELYELLPEHICESRPNNGMSSFQYQQESSIRNLNKGKVLKLSVDHIRDLQTKVASQQERIRHLEHIMNDIRQRQQHGMQYNSDDQVERQKKKNQQSIEQEDLPLPFYSDTTGSSSSPRPAATAKPVGVTIEQSPCQAQSVSFISTHPDPMQQRSSLYFHPQHFQ